MAHPLYPRLRFPTPLEVATSALAVQEAYDKTKRVADVLGDIGSTIMDYTPKSLSRKDQQKVNRRLGTIQRHLRGKGIQRRINRRKKNILVNKGMPTSKQKKALVRYAKNMPVTSKRRKQPTLKKQVKEIKKSLKADQAYHTYKHLIATDLDCAVGKCNHTQTGTITTSLLETAMANLRYYNPSVPGTLTTADASTGTYSRLVHIKNISQSLTVRNNYITPCKYRIYRVDVKSDTNIAPLSYYQNGVSDQVLPASTWDETTSGIYLTDIDTFNQQWSTKVLKSGVLEAGKEITARFSTGSFDYDPSLVDSHNLAYQKKYKASAFMIRIEGVLGHDTVADQQTTLSCSVDFYLQQKIEFIYDAGTNLNDIYIDNDMGTTFTNSGVISNRPVVDNQAYSAS